MADSFFSSTIKHTQSSSLYQPQKLRAVGSSVQLNLLPINNPQEEIGPYSYDRNKKIGSGYSSKVYLGHKKNTSEEFAIKVIDLKKYGKSNFQMLDNELLIMPKLQHPNVVRCHDVFRTKDKCFIVTEYCAHGDLLSYLSKRDRLTENASVQIIQDIIEGYKYLIEQNVLHRDLKPANIIKGKTHWKIADFGFAIKSEFDLKTRYNVGTPLYMSPEALLKNHYSVKSDIFSIGIVLYELLVGCTPWQSKTEEDLIRKLTSIPFKIPDKIALTLRMRNYLKNMCNTDNSHRMGKHEFLSLQLKQEKISPIPLETSSKPTSRILIHGPTLKLNRVKSFEHLKLPLSSTPSSLKSAQSESTSGNEEEEDRQSRKNFQLNTKILLTQLNYCKFMSFLRQICQKLPFQKDNMIDELTLVSLKHSSKLTKLLSDSNHNWFKLKDWSDYKKSSKFLQLFFSIRDEAAKTEKEYLNFLKETNVTVIKNVNQEFYELSYTNFFTQKTFEKLLNFVGKMIKQNKKIVEQVSLQYDFPLKKQTNQSVEALKYLTKYYKLIQMSLNNFENYECFEKMSDLGSENQKISIHTLSSFLQLRNQLKLI